MPVQEIAIHEEFTLSLYYNKGHIIKFSNDEKILKNLELTFWSVNYPFCPRLSIVVYR